MEDGSHLLLGCSVQTRGQEKRAVEELIQQLSTAATPVRQCALRRRYGVVPRMKTRRTTSVPARLQLVDCVPRAQQVQRDGISQHCATLRLVLRRRLRVQLDSLRDSTAACLGRSLRSFKLTSSRLTLCHSRPRRRRLAVSRMLWPPTLPENTLSTESWLCSTTMFHLLGLTWAALAGLADVHAQPTVHRYERRWDRAEEDR